MEQKYINLYDEYTHSNDINRRDFVDRLIKLAGSSALALALLPSLENNQTKAQTVPKDDKNLETKYIEYQGASGKMRGYLAMPKKVKGKIPAVVIIHENKGLQPHIEDVARRAALAGFIALAPDALSQSGGTPADADKARELIGKLDYPKTVGDFVAAVNYLQSYKNSNGNVGCVGFCWGGSMANQLAVNAANLKAAVAFYGGQPKAEDVAKIKAAVQLHYAGLDERIDAGIPAYEAALKKNNVEYELYMYEGVNHAFHNDTNEARYNAAAAKLAWQRTIKFLEEHLSEKKKDKKTK
ncbi:MAG: dienelactone hydrolase family protein [Acidobacteriota bacterium]